MCENRSCTLLCAVVGRKTFVISDVVCLDIAVMNMYYSWKFWLEVGGASKTRKKKSKRSRPGILNDLLAAKLQHAMSTTMHALQCWDDTRISRGCRPYHAFCSQRHCCCVALLKGLSVFSRVRSDDRA